MILRRIFIAITSALTSIAATAQEVDSVAVAAKHTAEEYTFNATQLILPAALVTVGAFGVGNGWMCKIKGDVRDGMERMRGGHYFHADEVLQYLPAAAYLGMGAIGVPSRHRFMDRLLAGATAGVAVAALTYSVKYSVREQRPDLSGGHSFPSGHTAVAFAGAELIRLEYGRWWAIGAYTVATGVAFLRLYNGAHWLNDVIAGAGIGILSARIGYWMLPLYHRWFHMERRGPGAPVGTAAPFYSPATGSIGLSLVAYF